MLRSLEPNEDSRRIVPVPAGARAIGDPDGALWDRVGRRMHALIAVIGGDTPLPHSIVHTLDLFAPHTTSN